MFALSNITFTMILITSGWKETQAGLNGIQFVLLGEERLSFDVSMWHQIHCLNSIRAVLLYGDDGSDHTEHCFHHLRQAILCAADTNPEPGGTRKVLENGDVVAAGTESEHTCRD
jgi:hypothetical protein